MNKVKQLFFVAIFGISALALSLQAMETDFPPSVASSTRALDADSPDSAARRRTPLFPITLQDIPAYRPASTGGITFARQKKDLRFAAGSLSTSDLGLLSSQVASRPLSRMSNSSSSSSKRTSAVARSLQEATCSPVSEFEMFDLFNFDDACKIVMNDLENMLRDGHVDIFRSASVGEERRKLNQLLKDCREFLTQKAKILQEGMHHCYARLSEMQRYLSQQCGMLNKQFWGDLVLVFDTVIAEYKVQRPLASLVVSSPVTFMLSAAPSPELAKDKFEDKEELLASLRPNPTKVVSEEHMLLAELGDMLIEGNQKIIDQTLNEKTLAKNVKLFFLHALENDDNLEILKIIDKKIRQIHFRYNDRLTALSPTFWEKIYEKAHEIAEILRHLIGRGLPL